MPTEDAPQACLNGASSVGIHWTNVQHRGCAPHRRDGCSSVDERESIEDAPQACLNGASSVGIHWTNVQHRGCAKHRRDGCSSVDRRKDERPTSRLCEARTRWLFERKQKEGRTSNIEAVLRTDERKTSRWREEEVLPLFPDFPERERERSCGSS